LTQLYKKCTNIHNTFYKQKTVHNLFKPKTSQQLHKTVKIFFKTFTNTLRTILQQQTHFLNTKKLYTAFTKTFKTILQHFTQTCSTLYETLQNARQLFLQTKRTWQNFTKKRFAKLHKTFQDFTILSKRILNNFTKLSQNFITTSYTTLHNLTKLYKTSQHSIQLYKTLHSSTQLYKTWQTLQNSTQLYTTLHNFTTL